MQTHKRIVKPLNILGGIFMANSDVHYASSIGYPINNKADVIKLVSYSGCRPFDLFKVEQYDATNWTYMMLIDNDALPIIISEELAQKIIANPSIGGEIAYNTWYERHR